MLVLLATFGPRSVLFGLVALDGLGRGASSRRGAKLVDEAEVAPPSE